METAEETKPKVLYGLRSEEYEHPLDRQALNALEGTPGLETLIRKVNEYGFEKLLRAQHAGSNIRVSKKHMPDIYEILHEVCETIYLKNIPELYVQGGYHINAFAIGSENPIIVLNEGIVYKFTRAELKFVVGHEVGHIKSQHVVYKMLAEYILPYIGDLIGRATLGIGNILSTPIQIALLNWSRKAEYTCDRAGLLAGQDIDAAITAMMKIAGAPECHYDKLDPALFLEQASEFESMDEDHLDRLAKLVGVMSRTHPWTVMRCHEMDSWIKAGAYDYLLKKYSDSSQCPSAHAVCPTCSMQSKPGAKFCIHCGNSI